MIFSYDYTIKTETGTVLSVGSFNSRTRPRDAAYAQNFLDMSQRLAEAMFLISTENKELICTIFYNGKIIYSYTTTEWS